MAKGEVVGVVVVTRISRRRSVEEQGRSRRQGMGGAERGGKEEAAEAAAEEAVAGILRAAGVEEGEARSPSRGTTGDRRHVVVGVVAAVGAVMVVCPTLTRTTKQPTTGPRRRREVGAGAASVDEEEGVAVRVEEGAAEGVPIVM